MELVLPVEDVVGLFLHHNAGARLNNLHSYNMPATATTRFDPVRNRIESDGSFSRNWAVVTDHAFSRRPMHAYKPSRKTEVGHASNRQ